MVTPTSSIDDQKEKDSEKNIGNVAPHVIKISKNYANLVAKQLRTNRRQRTIISRPDEHTRSCNNTNLDYQINSKPEENILLSQVSLCSTILTV